MIELSTYRSKFMMEAPKSSISLAVCQCGWQSSSANHFYGPLVRNYYVIHYIVKGRGRYEVDGKTYSLEKGDGFVIFPGEKTFYQADAAEPWEYYWVGFYGNEAKRMLDLSGLNQNSFTFSYKKDDKYEKHISDIYFASQQYVSQEFAMIGYLYLFFSCIIQHTASTQNYHQLYFEQATAYIEQKFKNHLTVKEIALHIGIDRSYLYRIFKICSNLSVKEYIDLRRLSMAKDLLVTTSMSITDISAHVGFQSCSHFSKKFKSVYRASPGNYKKTAGLQTEKI